MVDLFDALFGPIPEKEGKKQREGLLRPSFVKRPVINVEQWFEAGPLWEYVKDRLRVKSAPFPVAQITHSGRDYSQSTFEAAYFFGKQKEIANLDTERAWDRVLIPLLDDIEEVLNAKKPEGLTGRLRFDVVQVDPDSPDEREREKVALMLLYLDE